MLYIAEEKIPVVAKAEVEDVKGISQLVNAYARSGDLLPRSPQMIYDSIDDWVVAKMGGKVIGCGSLLVYEETLAEVRSLAIAKEAQGLGLGRALVEAIINDGIQKGIPTLFALTRAVPFFLRLGFTITNKERFPQKVWTDCHICPIKDDCDETAVVKEIAV